MMDVTKVPWHSLDPSEVAGVLDVDASKGLSEAQVRERRARYGSNVFGELRGPGVRELFIAQFRSLIVALLLFHMFSSRSEHFLLRKTGRKPNPYLWIAFAVALALQLAGLYVPTLQLVLRTVPLLPSDWLFVLVAALAPAVLVEFSKLFWPIEYERNIWHRNCTR